MASNAFVSEIIGLLSFLALLCISDSSKVTPDKFFDVRRYSAVSDGKTDNSQAFLKAWREACNCDGKCWVSVPKGTYKLGNVGFVGPCKGVTGFLIRGAIVAPTDPAQFTERWILFQYVENLLIKGGGTLDGQGASAWPHNDCRINPHCKPLPATLSFDFVTHSRIHHLKSLNSKSVHFNLFACNNITINKVELTAPADSPNTDGIRIGQSNHIKISQSVIGTGDDCIAMINGVRNVVISNVSCGPGHGISIGSLGRASNEQVHDIKVLNCNISNTQNGLRVKTWAPSFSGMVSNLTYQNILMNEVSNPIIFDQNYCPNRSCSKKAQSRVKISNATFKNIRGTSRSKIAVNFQCSGVEPCDRSPFAQKGTPSFCFLGISSSITSILIHQDI
ncbi:hypothetical protein ACET3Z_017671 [Daucus carota]